MSLNDPPELIVKFWPPSVTARGRPAINAVRRPVAFAFYSRPFVTVALAVTAAIGGGSVFVWGGRFFKQIFGF